MATGYVFVEGDYVARRNWGGMAHLAVDCSIGNSVTVNPFLWIWLDERQACIAMVRAYLRRGWRLVTVDFDDPGDITETQAPGSVGSPWVGTVWEMTCNAFTVTGELDAGDIAAVLAA